MQRIWISLTEDDRRLLDKAAARTGQSIAGLIQHAVHIVYADQRSVEDDLEILQATSGAWTGRTSTAEQQVERLRSGRRLQSPD